MHNAFFFPFFFFKPQIPFFKSSVSDVSTSRGAVGPMTGRTASSSQVSFIFLFMFLFLMSDIIIIVAHFITNLYGQNFTSPHLSLNREGRWGTTDDFTTSFPIFLRSPMPSGTWRTPGLSIIIQHLNLTVELLT